MATPQPPAGMEGPRALSRRRWLQALGAAACIGTVGAAQASAGALPLVVSLREELAQALRQGHPLVVMVSLDGCPFCKVARQNYLLPLREQQELPVVQLDMRSSLMARDFKGAPVSHDAMSRAWGIRIAPTVLFFGRDGLEVAERLVGGYIPDFYGAYLDQRLLQAHAALR